MRIEQKVTVDAPRHLVWEYVTDPANYPVFMDGLTRWEVAGDRDTGLGARYRMLLSVGAPFWQDTLESLFGLKNFLRKKEQAGA